MATSGNFLTSSSGQGGGNYYDRMIFEWWQTASGISGSVGYHNISYHLKTYGGSSSYWQRFYNGSMNVDGAGYSWGTTTAYGNGATVFGDYGKTLYTDSSGNRSFSASAQGGIVNNTINTSGSGSWSLDNIALYGAIDSWSSGSITDEDSLTASWHHYAGNGVLYLRLDDINNTESAKYVYAPSNPYTYTSLQSWAQGLMVNTNSTRMFLYYGDDLDGNGSVDHYNSAWIGTISIKNDTGQANPTFTTYTYKDNNSTTAAITGNDQYLIQGNSDLLVTITAANKATPNKGANMDHYTVTIGGYSNNVVYSSSSTVTKDVGAVSDVTGARTLAVQAVDSRGNSKTVNQTVNILPYAAPVVQSSASRANGYDDALILTIAGSVSPLTVSGTDKNTIHSTGTSTANKVEYRFATDGGSFGSWTDVSATQTATTGAVAGNSTVTIAAQGTVSATHSYQIEVRITDKLNATVQSISIPSGKPTFRIGLDGKLYNNEEQINVIPMISVLADDADAVSVNGTGTITPWSSSIKTLYVHYGTGAGNSSTIVFDVSFSFWVNATSALRTWALKIDGVVVGDSARKFFVNATSTHVPVHGTIVATGIAAGTHTVAIELYGGGNDIRTDNADYLNLVATEYINAYVS